MQIGDLVSLLSRQSENIFEVGFLNIFVHLGLINVGSFFSRLQRLRATEKSMAGFIFHTESLIMTAATRCEVWILLGVSIFLLFLLHL